MRTYKIRSGDLLVRVQADTVLEAVREALAHATCPLGVLTEVTDLTEHGLVTYVHTAKMLGKPKF
jgi:hypothetical protein